MKIKALLLLPGTLALMLAASPVIPSFISPAVAGSAHGQKWDTELNLSDTQEAQIHQFRQTAKQQMDDVLTADQKAQLQQARQQHTRPKLNLSDDQKARMKAIHQQTETNIIGVLNPDQVAKYQQLRQARRQRWQQKHQQQQQQQ
jgi:Spy/CpxP family protein refolding chaperone